MTKKRKKYFQGVRLFQIYKMQDPKRKEAAVEKEGTLTWSNPWKPRVHRFPLSGLQSGENVTQRMLKTLKQLWGK